MKKKMGRTAENEVVRENLFLDFLNCSCHKKSIIAWQILCFHKVINFREIKNRNIVFLPRRQY